MNELLDGYKAIKYFHKFLGNKTYFNANSIIVNRKCEIHLYVTINNHLIKPFGPLIVLVKKVTAKGGWSEKRTVLPLPVEKSIIKNIIDDFKSFKPEIKTDEQGVLFGFLREIKKVEESAYLGKRNNQPSIRMKLCFCDLFISMEDKHLCLSCYPNGDDHCLIGRGSKLFLLADPKCFDKTRQSVQFVLDIEKELWKISEKATDYWNS